MQPEPTVFIVDDDSSVRESLSYLLKTVGYQVKTFDRADAFLDQYDASMPGCAILDVRMPGMDGLSLQRHLAQFQPHLPVIMLTAHGDIPTAVDAVKSGALHFIEKPFEKNRLLRCIEESIRRDAEFRRTQSERVEIVRRLGTLSEREREVLDLLIAGKSAKLIAMILGTSPHTVAHQRSSIQDKMHAESVVELVQMVMLANDPG